jgi:hypothetical protein
LGLPVTLCCHAHWLATVPVIFSRFGFDWANAKLVPSTVMIAAVLAIFFMFHPLFLLQQHSLAALRHAIVSCGYARLQSLVRA